MAKKEHKRKNNDLQYARLCKLQKGCTLPAAASDKAYRWFSHGTPASSTTKTGRHAIAEILLKVALSTMSQINHILVYYLIYPPELEVKEITDTASSASFLDLYLEVDDIGQISPKIFDKRDDFNFKIINFPNMCSNIPDYPAYGVYIS
jgi:hypothetical protein